MKQKNILIAVILILSQSIVYGFGDPISKNAYESVSVFSLLTVRYWIAFLFLMIIFGRKVVSDLKGKSFVKILIPSFCIALSFILSNVAINMTSPTSVAFLKSTSTILTPIMAYFAFRKRYSKAHIPILVVVIAGLYLLCNPGGSLKPGMGEVLALLSALLSAGSLVFAEDAIKDVGAITITTVQAGTSAVLVTICALVTEKGVHMGGANTSVWLTIVYMAICCTVGGFILQNFALKSASASTVAILQCTYPVMTAVFSFIIINERLTTGGIIGSVIILICVVAENIVTANEEKNQIG